MDKKTLLHKKYEALKKNSSNFPNLDEHLSDIEKYESSINFAFDILSDNIYKKRKEQEKKDKVNAINDLLIAGAKLL